MVGQVGSYVDLDPSVDEFLVSESSDSSAYVLKLQDGYVGVAAQQNMPRASLYPFPIQSTLNILLDQWYDQMIVEVSDYTGKIIDKHEFGGSSLVQMNFDAPNGISFVRIITTNEETVFKVIKTN